MLSGCASPAKAELQRSKVALISNEWLATNRWDSRAKIFYLAGHKNPYLSTATKPVQYWDYWCAGFVGQVIQAAYGTPDPIFVAAAPSLNVPPEVRHFDPIRDTPDKIGAKVAFSMMQKVGRVRTDWENMPAGSAVFWTGHLRFGHVAIYTGDRDSIGAPLIITTGWHERPGTRLRTLSELNADLGAPAGWVAL